MKSHQCEHCGQPASSKCKGCDSAWYCSRACQRDGWKTHKASCKAMRKEKLQKDAARAEKKSWDNVARRQSDMADQLASQMAQTAARLAHSSKITPAQSEAMRKFSRDMAAAVQAEKDEKASGNSPNTSWIHDKEKRKSYVENIGQVDKEMAKMGLGTLPAIERFMTSMAGPPDANGNYNVNDILAGTEREMQKNPTLRDNVMVLEYTGACGAQVETPSCFQDLLNGIEPVLPILQKKFDRFMICPPQVQKKFHKLQSDVEQMRSLGKKDRVSFSRSELVAKQKKWQLAVGNIYGELANGFMQASLAQKKSY